MVVEDFYKVGLFSNNPSQTSLFSLVWYIVQMYLGTYRLSKMMEKSMAEKVSKKEKST